MNNYKIINEQTWKRAMHCAVFRNCVEPAFCVTFELDITNFLKKIKKQKYSFTMGMIYAVSKCANEIEEFRYRFVDGNVVLFDKIDTAFTYMNKDTELFKVVNVPMADTIEEYVAVAAKVADEQQDYFQVRLAMMCFNSRLCHGYHIRIFHIPIQAKRIMRRHCSIGVNFLREMGK